MDVRATPPLPFLRGASAPATGRVLHVSRATPAQLEFGRSEPARVICVRARPDGSEYFRIQAHPRRGYLIWGEGRGSYLLSKRGDRLRCATDGHRPHAWQRFMIGQVLPFAALASGLEILHASAVVLDDARAVALAGPSGAGKTSLALALCRAGARFLADDVLALEARADALMAQPGTPLAGVDRREAGRLRDRGAPLPGEVLGSDSGELLLAVDGAPAPARLHALFFLERHACGRGAPRFEPAYDARLLLGSTFNFVLQTPARMRGLLEVCALLASGVVERIVVPGSVDAGELAHAVISRLGATS